MDKFSLRDLSRRRTLSTSQADDLKIERRGLRVWLSRCGVEDGEPYDNKVTIEEFIGGRWVETYVYEAV